MYAKHRPCRLAQMAGKVVRTEESENRNVPQDSSRHHGGEESVEREWQQLGVGTADRRRIRRT